MGKADGLVDRATERKLLHVLLVNPRLLDEVSLPAAAFVGTTERRVYQAMRRLAGIGREWDAIAITHELQAEHPEEPVKAEIMQLLDDWAAPSALARLEERIVRAYRQRQAFVHAEVLVGHLGDLRASDDEIAGCLDAITTILAQQDDMPSMSWSDVQDAYGEWSSKPVRSVRFGQHALSALDVQSGELCLVIARPKVGKSAFLQNAVIAAARANPNAQLLYVSLEMPLELVFERFVQIHEGWTRAQFTERYGFDGAACAGTLGMMTEELQRVRFNFAPAMTTAQLQRIIRAHRAARPVDAVYVDGFDQLSIPDSRDSRADRYRDMLIRLKAIAKQEHVALFVVGQASRDAGGDGERELGTDAARGTAGVEENCDLLLGLWRPELEKGIGYSRKQELQGLLMAKTLVARRHPSTKVGLRFEAESLQVLDQPDEQRELYA